MERDIMKIVLGIFFMGILPVLFVVLQKKRGYLFQKDCQRRMIYFMNLITVCGILLYMGNMEMVFAVIIGSSVFQLFIVEGITAIQGKGFVASETNENMQTNRKNSFSENWKYFLQNINDSNSFLCISFILLLLLCGDNLFGKGQSENILGRIDGLVLIFMGMIYFFLEGKKVGWKNGKEKMIPFFKNNLIKKIVYFAILEICIFIGNRFLVDGILGISLDTTLFPYTMSFIFLSCVNMINIVFASSKENLGKVSYCQDSIFNITILLGICAFYQSIYITTYEIYDLIIVSLMCILFLLPKKIDSRLAGCCKVTAYLALILYILFR